MDIWQYMCFIISYIISYRFQGSYLSGDMKFHVFSRLFPGKSNEIPGQFNFESQGLS